jgi:LacI family transcriptional regulator
MEKLVSATLADVAAHAGVSLATASRVLNGSTRRVRPDNAERVRSSAQELRYAANVQAQAVARGSSAVIALVVGDLADPYFASIAAGVVAEADRAGLFVTVVPATDGDGKTARLLLGMRPRAAIFASGRRTDQSPEEHQELLNELRLRGIRPIAVESDDHGDVADGSTIRVANRAGARALGAELVRAGYRSFAIIGEDLHLVTARARVSGFRSGVGDAPVVSIPGRMDGGFARDFGYQQMLALIDAGPLPDCVFAPADVMALGAMRALRERGLVAGEDVGLAGFDDIPTLEDVTPSLTTVRLPLEELGRRTVQAALGIAGSGDVISGEVVLRGTTPRRR